MQCPRCQQQNPPKSNFCLGCGGRVALTCGSCGTPLPAGSRFCNKCGTAGHSRGRDVGSFHLHRRLHAEAACRENPHLQERALEGERKQVTVLFADLKGSMELLADRDPEEARKILDPVLER